MILDIAGPGASRNTSTLEFRRLASERSVFRGQVIAFAAGMFGFGLCVPRIPPAALVSRVVRPALWPW